MYRVVWEDKNGEQFERDWEDDLQFVCDQLVSIVLIDEPFVWIQIETKEYYDSSFA